MTKLGEVLTPIHEPVFVDDPATAKLISVRLHGLGAVRRAVGDGKAPKPFVGNRGTAGQFVFSRIWARRGAMAIIPEDLDGVVVTNEFPLFDIASDRLDAQYFKWLTSSPRFLAQLEGISAGASGQNRVGKDAFLKIQVSIPSLAEQRRIAAILDHADSLRAKSHRVLTHVSSLPHSIFREVFGQIAWTATMAELADIQIGPFGSLLHQSDYASDGVPVINPMHIIDSRIVPDPKFCISADKAKELQRYRLEIGDVVLGRRGLMGRAGIVQSDQVGALCGTGSIILRPRGINSRLLHSIVVSPVMKKYLDDHARGTTLPNLNSKIVAAAPAPVRDHESEDSFDVKLQAVEAMADRAAQAEVVNDELFTSLQSRAFRGEL